VVPAELPADFEPAAQRAQAIAARTYAWYHRLFYGSQRDWDLADNESSQVYLGVAAESRSPTGVQAVRDTAGIVCAYSAPEGPRIFPAYYSSTCGGASRFAPRRKGEPEYPPLAGDVRCDFCSASPAYRWPAVAISKKRITERLRDRYSRIAAIGPIVDMEISERTSLGRPVQVIVSDAAGRMVSLDVEDFRLSVDPAGRTIKSGYFTPVVQKDAILFADGRGFGHGWGMCQYGANTLAKAGKTAGEILSFYYPGSSLVRAY
jgi:stage II sporulation protein D